MQKEQPYIKYNKQGFYSDKMNEISKLLCDGLIGAYYDKDLSSCDEGLPNQHQFSWQTISAAPTADHGTVSVRGSWYKTMNYEVLHNGGFLRLFTTRGRIYWSAQNETSHITPDWKIHFSCCIEDIPRAWNSLAALFIDMKCEIGMKATTVERANWSERQRGREITVYLYR
jgi:hypothetical protein